MAISGPAACGCGAGCAGSLMVSTRGSRASPSDGRQDDPATGCHSSVRRSVPGSREAHATSKLSLFAFLIRSVVNLLLSRALEPPPNWILPDPVQPDGRASLTAPFDTGPATVPGSVVTVVAGAGASSSSAMATLPEDAVPTV